MANNKILTRNRILLGSLAAVLLFLYVYLRNGGTRSAISQKILVTACPDKIKGLDPIQTNDVFSARQAARVYESLFEYHYLKRPFELIPNLAAAMPTVSEDGCTYTIKVKQGVHFHDNPCFPKGKGRALTAEDFVFALKRLADPHLRAPWFSLLAGKVKGLDTWRQEAAGAAEADYTKSVAGLKATDKYTLQIILNKPWPQLPHVLAMTFCSAVPHEAVSYYGPEFINHPVGTGPFILKAFNPQTSKLTFERNPTFREKHFPSEAAEVYQHLLADAGKRLPLVDKVITHILPEEAPRWLKFQKGQFDVLDIAEDNIALKAIKNGKLIPTLDQQGVKLCYEPELSTDFFVINCSHPLFQSNLKLRQALSMAFDGEQYNKLFYDTAALLAQSIIPPGLSGYKADYVNPYRVYDLKKAQEYLAAAGYPRGKGLPVLTLDVNANTKTRQQGEFFQQCMEKIGVRVKIVPNVWPELLKKIAQHATMLHTINWIGDYPDAENFLYLLYRSDKSVGIGAGFTHPRYNALYEKAAVMRPSVERRALYEQLNKIAGEQVPMIYSVHRPHPVLYQGWVKNYLWTSVHYGTEQYLDIDENVEGNFAQ